MLLLLLLAMVPELSENQKGRKAGVTFVERDRKVRGASTVG
jgi:hypothetical protein